MTIQSFLCNIKYIIKYKYNLYWDIVWFFRNKKNAGFLYEKNIKLLPFSLKQFFKNIFSPPKPEIKSDENIDIICYWLSSGTWGSYTPPNKIFICPTNINKAGGLERVIKHEIAHLLYFKNTAGMSHEQKEKYIRNKEESLSK